MKDYPMLPGASRNAVFACLIILLSTCVSAAEIKFIPMMILKEEYNNNVFFSTTDAQEEHDSITTISPGAKIIDRTERLDSVLQSRFDILKYHDLDDFDTTDQQHSGSVSYQITERWGASAETYYTRDSKVDRDIETTGLVIGTARRVRQHYGGGTDYALSEKASASLGYSYDEETFNSSDFIDSTTQNANLGMGYSLDSWLSRGTLFLNAGYTLYDYTNTHVTSYSGTIGIKKQLNELFTISGRIGRSLTRSRFETFFLFFPVEETSIERGNIGSIEIAYADERANANLSLNQDIRGLSGQPGTIRRMRLHFDAGCRFTRKLRGSIITEYFLNKANEGELATANIDECTWQVQPRLRYAFTDDLILESSYRFIRLKDFEADEKHLQTLCYLRLIWQYPITH